MTSIEKTPDEEAEVAVMVLDQWAQANKITIDNFMVVPLASWENRQLAVRGRTQNGNWAYNTVSVDNLCEARAVDDALFVLASAKGWAEFQAGQKLS